MKTTDTISELTAALAKAQGEFKPVKKSGKNPHLRNVYSTLDDVIAAVRVAMSAHGLSFVQPLTGAEDGFTLETYILHESGEWLSCSSNIPALAGNKGVNALQAFGGALTYMRRYMLTSLLGVTTEEDRDGNGSGKTGEKPAQKPGQPAQRPAQKPTKAIQEQNGSVAASYPPVNPSTWDELPVPADWSELYTRVTQLHISGDTAEGRRIHTANIIKGAHPIVKATVPSAWQALIDHQRSKIAEAEDAINAAFPLAEPSSAEVA